MKKLMGFVIGLALGWGISATANEFQTSGYFWNNIEAKTEVAGYFWNNIESDRHLAGYFWNNIEAKSQVS